MSRHRLAVAGAAIVAVLAAGCEDVPFVPKWDADWNVPLPSSAIYLQSSFGTLPIPPGASANISFPPQQQTLDEAVGEVLRRDLRAASLILTLTKSANLQFSATDTLFVAASQADLTNAAANRIVVPVTFAASDVAVTDTTAVTSGGLTMLQTVAGSPGGELWIQLRGRATFEGSGFYTVQPTDSIGVKLALLVRIGVSTR
jgi:hypothetical protein